MSIKLSKSCFIIILLLCCGILLVFPGCAEDNSPEGSVPDSTIEKVYQRGPFTVNVRLDSGHISLSDTLRLELTAICDPGYKAEIPNLENALKETEDLSVIDWQKEKDRLDENNDLVSSFRYRLEPFTTGTVTIPALTFIFISKDQPDEKHEIITEPVDIEVSSQIDPENTSELTIADIKDVVDMPRKLWVWWLWITVIIALFTVVVVLIYKRKKRVKELIRIYRSAHEIALERLRALLEEDLHTTGKVKLFYEQISNILRHYIEHRFELKAPERTTEEFLAEITFTNELPEADKKCLGEFLMHCDLVKFAKHDPTTEDIQQTIMITRQFIERSKTDQCQIDVTDTALTKTAGGI